MRIRRMGLPVWAVMSVLWLAGVGVCAGSAWLEACFTDQVSLQQQAKDIRAAGGDPAALSWGGAIQIGRFTVPPAHLDKPLFWERHGASYAALGGSFPLATLILLEIAAQIVEGVRTWRQRAPAPCGRVDVRTYAPGMGMVSAPCIK